MQENKKINLLPQALKNKYMNRTLAYGAGTICGILALMVLFLYGNIGILSLSINNLIRENAAYSTEKQKIEQMQSTIAAHKTLLDSFEQIEFPFVRFMHDLDLKRPFGVSILSIDSADRLFQASDTEVPNTDDDTENGKKNDVENKETPAPPQIEYVKDLNGEKIIVRGYSDSQEAISQFIYDISMLDYISDTQVTAIEQHKLDDAPVNIFELVITGGAKH